MLGLSVWWLVAWCFLTLGMVSVLDFFITDLNQFKNTNGQIIGHIGVHVQYL